LRKYNSRAKMEMKFGLFRMKSDMTLDQFYEQFVEHRRILTAQRDEKSHPKRGAKLPAKSKISFNDGRNQLKETA
jgi:hypothetical protein